MFDYRLLRKIFTHKREEVTGGWGKFHSEELHNLYSSPNIMMIKWRRIRQAGHVAHVGEKRYAYVVLLGNPEARRLLRRPRHSWEVIIKQVIKNRMGELRVGECEQDLYASV